ncbi:MAG: TetR/AcrR family transcriptional regulator [Desulfitobacteriaceae bacterium]
MREKILMEAMRQILRLGLRKFTVEDIANELGMSKKTIYKCFSSKNEIISAVVDFVLEQEKTYTEQVMEMTTSHIIKMEALLFFHSGDGIPGWVVDELKRYYPAEYRKRKALQGLKKEYFNQLFAEGIQTGNIRGEVKSGVVNVMVRQTLDAILDGDFLDSQDLTLNQAIEQMKKIVLYGIVVRAEGEERGS